jgi:DNA-binding IclR family transcriptional regulator
LALLAAFDVNHPQLTLSELARRARLPLATVHRLAGELEQWRALDRDEQGRYGVGFRLWEMGLLAPVHSRLREVSVPFLLELHRQTQQNIQLAACDGFDAVYVEKLTSRQSVPQSSRVGARIPLHATGVGKALLAFQSSAFVEALLQRPLATSTPWTLTNRGALRRELAQVRHSGFATSAQEFRSGSCSVAVPVLHGSEAIAAVGMVAYSVRADLTAHVPALQAAAAGIASRLEASEGIAFPSLDTDPDRGTP